jgi:hypothetical protein
MIDVNFRISVAGLCFAGLAACTPSQDARMETFTTPATVETTLRDEATSKGEDPAMSAVTAAGSLDGAMVDATTPTEPPTTMPMEPTVAEIDMLLLSAPVTDGCFGETSGPYNLVDGFYTFPDGQVHRLLVESVAVGDFDGDRATEVAAITTCSAGGSAIDLALEFWRIVDGGLVHLGQLFDGYEIGPLSIAADDDVLVVTIGCVRGTCVSASMEGRYRFENGGLIPVIDSSSTCAAVVDLLDDAPPDSATVNLYDNVWTTRDEPVGDTIELSGLAPYSGDPLVIRLVPGDRPTLDLGWEVLDPQSAVSADPQLLGVTRFHGWVCGPLR